MLKNVWQKCPAEFFSTFQKKLSCRIHTGKIRYRDTFRLPTILKVRLQHGCFSKTLELTAHMQKGLTSAPFYDKIETCVPQEEAATVGVLKKGALFPTQYCHILIFSCFRRTKEVPWKSR